MSGTQSASKANGYAALGVGAGSTAAVAKATAYAALSTAQQASKANGYAALGVGAGPAAAVAKSSLYIVLAAPASYPLGTLMHQRERNFPRGFRHYPRLPYMLRWRTGR